MIYVVTLLMEATSQLSNGIQPASRNKRSLLRRILFWHVHPLVFYQVLLTSLLILLLRSPYLCGKLWKTVACILISESSPSSWNYIEDLHDLFGECMKHRPKMTGIEAIKQHHWPLQLSLNAGKRLIECILSMKVESSCPSVVSRSYPCSSCSLRLYTGL